MNRNNRIVKVALVLFTILLCSTLVSAQGQVVIRMYGGYDYRSDGLEGPAEILDRYLRMYEAENPHVKVENLGRELNVDKLINLYIAGELPDVIEIDVKFLADFYRIGMLAPVPERLADRLRQEMFPSSTDFISIGGQMVGIPGENMVTGLLYSRNALDQAGVAEPPQTLQELETLGRRLTVVSADGTVQLPALMESGGWALNHTALAMYAAQGGEAYDESGQLVVGGIPLQQTMERLVEWLQPGSFFAHDGFNINFYQGEVPFGFGYPWWLSGIRQTYTGNYLDNFGVTLMPMGATYGAFKYGHGYGVNRNSEHIDEVWRLLEWLSLNVIDDITPIGHMMASLGSLPNVPRDILSVQYAEERELYEGFIANLDYVRNTPAWERIDIANPALEVSRGEITLTGAVEKVITTAQAEVSRYLEWLEENRR